MAATNKARDGNEHDASARSHASSRYADFATRLNQCADQNPNVPQLGGGRLTFVRDRLASNGIHVSLEAVRRWFSGQAMPRRQYASPLAEALDVDARWLLEGGDERSRDHLGRNAPTQGALNLVAALIQLDGGAVAFPENADGYVDLYAIFDGIHHAIRIVVAKETQDGEVAFVIPTSPVKFVHIGVVRKPGLRHELYVITDVAIDAGQRDGAASKVTLRDKGVRRISSFEKALES